MDCRALAAGCWLALACGLVAPCAEASEPAILLGDGVLRGSPRVLGLAGAFVGIAEGGEGLFRNPAAAAGRQAHLGPVPDFDLGFNFHLVLENATGWQDWDNDGRPDSVTSDGRLSLKGEQVASLAVQLQWGRWGLGVGVEAQNLAVADASLGLDLALLRGFLCFGYSFGQDELLLGGGLTTAHALLGAFESRSPHGGVGAIGFGLELGALYRPPGRNFRVGMAFFSPQTIGADPSAVAVGGRLRLPEVVSPGRLLFGGSLALGPGSEAYNLAQTGPVPQFTRILLTAQLDLVFPVVPAVLPASALQSADASALPRAGGQLELEPRLGVEKEVLEDRLRVRAGGYLEPSPLANIGPRPHLTVGGEVLLFRWRAWAISFGVSVDLARDFFNLSFAPLFWK